MLSLPMVSRHGETTSSVEIPSSQLDSTHDQTTSGMALHDVPWAEYMVRQHQPWQCRHHPWYAHTVERRNTWHAIIALEKHTRSDDVGRGMLSMLLKSTHD